jgi:hypothetical protein
VAGQLVVEDGHPVHRALDDRLRRHREISRRIQAG